MKFFINDYFSKCGTKVTANLITFIEEILNGKLHFCRTCVVISMISSDVPL